MGRLLGGGREIRQAFPEPPVLPYPGAPYPGAGPMNLRTTDGALVIPTVWECVSLLSNAVSMLPMSTFKRNPDGIALKTADQPLLKKPAPNTTWSEWIHQVMVSLLLRGNVYGQITQYDKLGFPTQIVLLNPDIVFINQDTKTGAVTYRVGYGDGQREFKSYDDGGDLWHLRGMTVPGDVVGLSPITYAALALGVDIRSRQFGYDYFEGTSMPKAIVESDQEITQGQAQTIKDRIMGSMVARQPIVLGAGLRFVPMTVRADESQFLQTQHMSSNQIRKFFYSLPDMGGSEGHSSMTYANVEQRSIDFLTYCVSFWLRRIEDAMFFLLPGTVFAEFETKALLRTDSETTAAVHIQEIAAKLRTPTEIRNIDMNLPEMTAAQKAEVDLVPLITNVIGGSKLGVKVNTSLEQQNNPTNGNPIDSGPPAKTPKGEKGNGTA